jgi:galactokinase
LKPDTRARALFEATFGRPPAAVADAPGRVNLIGEHVDYHGGHVLPVATGARTAVAVGPARGLDAVSESSPRVQHDWPPMPRHDWSDYVAGVADVLFAEDPPWLAGLAAAVASDVPVGGGLSSSAAIEVATARALLGWRGWGMKDAGIADAAWRAETEFVGMPCGRMDQMASAVAPAGSGMLLDCRTLEWSTVPIALDLVVVDSGESHTLRGSAYADRRREGDEALALIRAATPAIEMLVDIPPARLGAVVAGLPPVLAKRVKHVVNENQRVMLAARALENGDGATVGALVNASHDSLRDLYECSTPALDAIVARARTIDGVLGARLVGAGWGGSALVVSTRGAGEEIARELGGTVVYS